MQSKASNETMWKRLYEDAVLELQPTLFGEKAKAAEKAILEVQDFTQAIQLSAQTALRESIGRHELHQMVAEREFDGPRAAADRQGPGGRGQGLVRG